MAKYDEHGNEILGGEPIAAPLNYRRPATLQERLRTMLRLENRAAAEAMESDDDFEIEEEPDFGGSEYELVEDPVAGEVSKAEKRFLDSQRKEFEERVAIERKRQREKKNRQLELEDEINRREALKRPPEQKNP